MIVEAVIKYLRTGAVRAVTGISDVYPLYKAWKTPNLGDGVKPYLIVYEPSSSALNTQDNGVTYIRVACVFPLERQADLDAFVIYKIKSVLDKAMITYARTGETANTQKVFATNRITSIAEASQTGYICRERDFMIPYRS